jgi:hypothetical protein
MRSIRFGKWQSATILVRLLNAPQVIAIAFHLRTLAVVFGQEFQSITVLAPIADGGPETQRIARSGRRELDRYLFTRLHFYAGDHAHSAFIQGGRFAMYAVDLRGTMYDQPYWNFEGKSLPAT